MRLLWRTTSRYRTLSCLKNERVLLHSQFAQMGTSSLLVRTFHRCKPKDFNAARIDMTRIGSENTPPLHGIKELLGFVRSFNLVGKII